jgi:phosphoribosylanthranilate isomerase
MSAQVKICGISTPDTLDAAIGSGASHVGFNFFPPSPRYLALDLAHALSARAEGRVQRVGVFVDPDDATLAAAIGAGALDAIQLNKVTAARRADVKARFGLPVWAVVPVRSPGDLDCRHQIDASSADFVLYDAATPAGAALPGGMGLRIDWQMMQGLSHPWPWGLAGGLDPGNVAEAIRITGAPLVDVASGVESAPGIKNVDKIAAFCRAVRAS